MTNKILLPVLALIFFTVNVVAKASLIIEPHIAYNIYGNADYNTFKTKFNGVQYGAHLGAQYLGFMGGLDFTRSTYTSKSTSMAGNTSADANRNQYGIFAGYNLPIFLRVWAVYYFIDKSSGTNNTWNKGNGLELGIGFTPISFVSINFEYRNSTYTKSNAGALNPYFKTKELVLGLSIPITQP
jgi:hypothetical protein